MKLNDSVISQLDKFSDKLKLSTQERNEILMTIQKPNSKNIIFILKYHKLMILILNIIYLGNKVYEFYLKLNQLEINAMTVSYFNNSTNQDTSKDKYAINLYRQDIINAIISNRILFIGGESGIGKSTRTPQIILDYYQMIGQKCRILIGQPDDFSAYVTASNLAKKRGEKLGDCIGYQTSANFKY